MITEMTREHLPQVLVIENLLFSIPWRERDFLFEIEQNPYAHYFVDVEDGIVRGFIGSWVQLNQGEITNLGVHPDYQRKGIGEQLLCRVLNQDIDLCTLEVRESNIKAISLYQKYGFKKAAVRKNYYDKPVENAYLMIKEVQV